MVNDCEILIQFQWLLLINITGYYILSQSDANVIK